MFADGSLRATRSPVSSLSFTAARASCESSQRTQAAPVMRVAQVYDLLGVNTRAFDASGAAVDVRDARLRVATRAATGDNYLAVSTTTPSIIWVNSDGSVFLDKIPHRMNAVERCQLAECLQWRSRVTMLRRMNGRRIDRARVDSWALKRARRASRVREDSTRCCWTRRSSEAKRRRVGRRRDTDGRAATWVEYRQRLGQTRNAAWFWVLSLE